MKKRKSMLKELAKQPGLSAKVKDQMFGRVQEALDDLLAECGDALERNKRLIDRFVEGL